MRNPLEANARESVTPMMMMAVVISLLVSLAVLLDGCRSGPESLESVQALPVEAGWSLRDIAWSPEGKSIAATVSSRHENGVYIIDLQSGEFHSITDDADRVDYEARGARWASDSEKLVLYYPLAILA
jgi:hypothetical protein